MAATQNITGSKPEEASLPPAVEQTLLPVATSSDLYLVRASPAENYQAWLLNENEWKGPLTHEQYIARERHLLKQDLTKNDNLTAWILTSKNLPANVDNTQPILAACETIQKNAYVARAGALQQVVTHGVGSVYTRPEYRGRGYAARMMTELAEVLETYQQPNGDRGSFSVLFSDIGQKFYARFGWQPVISTHIHLRPVTEDQYEELRPLIRQMVRKGLPEVHDLTASDLKSLQTIAHIESELKAQSEVDPHTPYVAIRPDLAHFNWHHAREEFQCQAIGKPFPEVKGAIHQETGIAIIWSRVFAHKPQDWGLHILHIVLPPTIKAAPTADDHLVMSALLLRAQKEAHTWDMQAGVEVWDPSGFVVTAAQKLKREEDGKVEVIRRDKEHICSLKWIGAQPGDNPTSKVSWLHCEKYAWC